MFVGVGQALKNNLTIHIMTTKRFLFTISLLLVLIFTSIIYVRSSLATDFSEDVFLGEHVGRVFLSAELYNQELLRIKAIAEDMEIPVLGTAFHLQYDSGNLAFLRHLPGDFLEKGGKPFYMAKDLPEQKKLVFGQTLKHDDGFPVGAGDLVYFDFQILGGTEWEFVFDRGVVSGPDPTRQDVDLVLWEDLFVSIRDFDYTDDEDFQSVASSSTDGSGNWGWLKSILDGRYVLPGIISLIGVFFAIRLFLSKRSQVAFLHNR